jgi:hypothetical protein
MSAILDTIKSVLPVIGTALGGPFGTAAATFIASKIGVPDATVEKVTAALAGMTPEQLASYKQLDNDFQAKMAEMGYDNVYKIAQLNAQAQSDVNKTMQVEATSEHWPSYSWRPFIGFMFGLYVASLFILPLFKVSPVIMPSEMLLAIGGILGVASYFRGKAQADPAVQNTSIPSQRG